MRVRVGLPLPVPVGVALVPDMEGTVPVGVRERVGVASKERLQESEPEAVWVRE